jgi:hypothetical protein
LGRLFGRPSSPLLPPFPLGRLARRPSRPLPRAAQPAAQLAPPPRGPPGPTRAQQPHPLNPRPRPPPAAAATPLVGPARQPHPLSPTSFSPSPIAGAAPARARPSAGAAPAWARLRRGTGSAARRGPCSAAKRAGAVRGRRGAWPARSRHVRSSGHGATACPAWWLAASERNARGLAPSPLPSPPLRAYPACPSVRPPAP